ncbi:putative RNA-directed DNA polymerase from transposon BS [Trichonephila clavipes]|nr:putative RNA-directed DNA polymerase from transposon BS [Trichonephila clavipes]
MILKRLMFYLNFHNLLPKEQYGFREGHSTIYQVLYFSQSVRDAQNKKHTNHTIAAFLDLSNAFDRVWTQKLITKLYVKFGIRDRALPWIYDFLRDRHIRVRFDSSTSNGFKISQGVPQGLVLSSILFTPFLAGIEKVINNDCETEIFADDIVLWSSGSDSEKVEESVNLALADVCFAVNHKLSFSPTKSTVGFFTTNRKLYNFQTRILLNSQPWK